ncbi:Alpha-hemolysin translocation ATP-binding protein HlyB [Prochlorococcus marinus str. MIT 1313]|uniref:ABC transporter transmembrane domain-containing protein n=1 Tax=Prochlorococcus TaxID=1218 RepID=UPI0007C12761|nr:ABC transporter transmembrane domain-containing protein [Prochlorococcus marinus]KZR67476.1 Alpha-hemolysin translocation ATP-binding protein HlyB [Prochlorococcus marinus str. MIT 1313]
MQLTASFYKHISDNIFNNSSVTTSEAGSLIFSRNTVADQLILLDSGEVRLIDQDRTFGSLTTDTLKAPFIIGISQLLDRSLHEEVRAKTVCTYRNIDLNGLTPEGEILISNILNDNISEFELPYLYKQIESNLQFKERVIPKYSIFKEKVFIYKPTSQKKSSSLLIYLDSPKDGFIYGQIITTEICNTFFSLSDFPRIAHIELLDISSDEILAIIEPNSTNTLNNHQQENVSQPSFLVTPELKNEDNSSEHKGYRLSRGSNRKECFVSSLKMLTDFFEVPIRRDTLLRAADVLDQDDINWNIRMLSIMDSFGFAVRAVRINIDNPFRLPLPCIWIDDKGMSSVIVNTNNRELTILNPLKGIEKLNLSDASALLSESPQVISVEIGLHTPRKRFSLAWLFPYVQKYRAQLVEVFAASFLNQLFALATPLLFQQIIDRVISKGAIEALSPLVILMLIFVVLETTFASLRTFQFVEVSNRIDISVGSAIISRMLKLNARFFDSRPVGELSSRLGELDNIRRFLTGTALTAVLDAIFAILYFAVMFFYSTILTFAVILTIPFLFAVTVGITPITQRLIRRRAEAASRTQALLVEILGGIQTVKLQNAELASRKKWEERHLNSINQGFKAILANTTSSNALQLINKVSSIIVIGIGSTLVVSNQLTLGQLIAFRIISGYVTQPMLRLASSWQSFQEMSLSLERVSDIVNQPLEIGENEEGHIVMPAIEGTIKADEVGFSYSSTTTPVLSSVSLDIKAGSFVGLVGQSGCGKSTFLKMIPRLYTPTSGRILIDNYDISKVDLYSLRQQLGYVPQDCMLFEGTIFSNIALGDPQAESNKVIEMAKIACAHEFIMNLPNGYSTPVGEKGAGLSGGQRQRIALSRMLLENPNMVVLDEATSALDVDTERQVVSNLRSYFSKSTLLMITHRLSTLTEADQIIVMHTGRVDSVGTHLELIEKKGRYFALYQSQFGEPT